MTSAAYESWIDLSEHDVRSLLIALIGLDFGPEPEKRIPEIRKSREAFSNYIANECRISSSDVMLDLGSGCGFATFWFAKRARHVHACDVSPAYLNFAKRECAGLDNVSFHLIESRKLSPFGDNSLDAVCSMSVFIHLNLYDIFWYFSEFRRVVKPGGRVWIDVADTEALDLSVPNIYRDYFLRHAETYRDNPSALPGLMQWNSLAAVLKIANHFGFEREGVQTRGELVLIKRESGDCAPLSLAL